MKNEWGSEHPLRKELVRLTIALRNEMDFSYESQILLLHKLDSEEKTAEFFRWAKSRVREGKLEATEAEICRAAVKISKGLDEECHEKLARKRVKQIIKGLLDVMTERQYPGSVKQTVVGVIDLSSDPLKTATEMEPLVLAAKTPKEVVKAVQPYFE